MTTKTIQQLDDAILAEMQSAKRTGLSFRELKVICSTSMPLLSLYHIEDCIGRAFMHEMLGNIANLENNGLVKITRRGKFILRIDLTERGQGVLKDTLYTQKV